MNPTAMLHITIATIDARSLQLAIVGFAVFPLFIDPKTSLPIINSRSLEFDDLMEIDTVLHFGAYQIPIYSEYPAGNNTVNYEHFLNLERIPTASALIRVDFASIDEDGNFASVRSPDPKLRALAYDPCPNYLD